MKNLLALLCVAEWFANDLHYKSTGIGFYEKHLLADRVRDFGSSEDDIKEKYFLGYKGELPPLDVDIAKTATFAYNKIVQDKSTELERLEVVFGLILASVEECKSEENLPSGVQSVLDKISEDALTYKFLVRSESGMTNVSKTTTTDTPVDTAEVVA